MTGRLEGKVALVTGAARGAGRATAVRLAQEGADIIALDLAAAISSASYGVSAASELGVTGEQVAATGRRVVLRHADIRDAAALTTAVDEGVAELGRLDIVNANAAIISGGEVMGVSEETWNNVLGVNVTGTWNTMRAVIPHIRAGGNGGSIIITSSVAGLRGQAKNSTYVTSKHAGVGLMRSLALELGSERIRVNTVHPTTIETPMVDNPETYKVFRPDLENPTREEFLEGATAIHALPIAWVQPEDIANAVLFLASDEARYVTGVTLPVDGGDAIK